MSHEFSDESYIGCDCEQCIKVEAKYAIENMLKKRPTFEEVWAKKKAEGYQYGHDALQNVKFGWELRESCYTRCVLCLCTMDHSGACSDCVSKITSNVREKLTSKE